MGARILLVEDVPHNRELVGYLLGALGHQVIPAATGEEGVALATADPPDLIVTDLHLPGIDGYEVLRAIRAQPRLATVPVIAVTAFAMDSDRQRVRSAGFDAYLTKPVDPQVFHAQIEELLPAHLHGSRAAQVPSAPSTIRPTEIRQPRFRAHILLVDDNLTNHALLRSVLEPHGYRLSCVASIQEALTAIGRTRPDLVLSDVDLTDERGPDLLARLRANAAMAEIPFAFITASAAQVDTLGRDHHVPVIRTPIEPTPLLARVDSLLGQSRDQA